MYQLKNKVKIILSFSEINIVIKYYFIKYCKQLIDNLYINYPHILHHNAGVQQLGVSLKYLQTNKK